MLSVSRMDTCLLHILFPHAEFEAEFEAEFDAEFTWCVFCCYSLCTLLKLHLTSPLMNFSLFPVFILNSERRRNRKSQVYYYSNKTTTSDKLLRFGLNSVPLPFFQKIPSPLLSYPLHFTLVILLLFLIPAAASSCVLLEWILRKKLFRKTSRNFSIPFNCIILMKLVFIYSSLAVWLSWRRDTSSLPSSTKTTTVRSKRR